MDEETGEKRQAYADDLTDGQLKFIFFAQQEKEKMKKEKAQRNQPASHNF